MKKTTTLKIGSSINYVRRNKKTTFTKIIKPKLAEGYDLLSPPFKLKVVPHESEVLTFNPKIKFSSRVWLSIIKFNQFCKKVFTKL